VVLDSLSTADRVNLLELYARSVMLIELGRTREWAELFVPEGWATCESPLDESLKRPFKGRAQLLDLARQMAAGEFDLTTGRLTPVTRCRRVLTDISLFAEGSGSALGFAHLTVTSMATREPPRWIASGRYHDRLGRNASGCCQFNSRTFIADDCAAAVVSASPPRGLGAIGAA
jgi:SnoaL-like domain